MGGLASLNKGKRELKINFIVTFILLPLPYLLRGGGHGHYFQTRS